MNDNATKTKAETRQYYEKLAAEAAEYCPPLETVCRYCGGRCVGPCSLNACSDIGRGVEER